MAGTLINIIPKTLCDFGDMAPGISAVMPLGYPIDVLPYTDAAIIVRIHSYVIGAFDTINFGLYPDGHLESSDAQFFGRGVLVSVDLFSSTPAPTVLVGSGAVLGAYLSLGMFANRAVGSVVTAATVSVDVCLRNPDEIEDASQRSAPFGSLSSDFRESHPKLPLLQQLFQPWGLDVSTVRFVVKPLDGGLDAQAQSDSLIALSPRVMGSKDSIAVMGTLAHELTHVAQIRQLGWSAAAARATREEQADGPRGTRRIPGALAAMFPGALSPVDPRFSLEAIAGHMGQIARGIVPSAQTGKSNCNCGSSCNC